MTNQEIFDKSATHLVTQNKRAAYFDPFYDNPPPQCKYRIKINGEVLSCAVGCLIKNEDYDENIECNSVAELTMNKTLSNRQELLKEILTKSGVSFESYPLLMKLQYIHDNILPTSWKEELILLAKSENLEVPKILLE